MYCTKQRTIIQTGKETKAVIQPNPTEQLTWKLHPRKKSWRRLVIISIEKKTPLVSLFVTSIISSFSIKY